MPRRPDWLTARPYAHRGLHGAGRIENSRAAIEKAIKAGYGVEIDVRASRDGTVFVFHDATLQRLCGRTGRIGTMTSAALAEVTLAGSGETIVSLADVLALVGGRSPLLIEMKSDPSPIANRRLCAGVAAALENYGEEAAVMSFNPRMVRWFAINRPDRIRGLVMSEEGRRKFRPLVARRLALASAKPDFLAYDVRSLPSRLAIDARAKGIALLSWTVRSEADRAHAYRHVDQIIHELP